MKIPPFFSNMDPLINPAHNNPGFNPDATRNWFDVWNDWAWHSQENNILTSSGEVQFSEWSQQMLSTMYQNWYNSAPEQMKRAMEAGINPFIAASGIAGSDSGNVASPPPSTPNRGAELLNAASNLGNMLGNQFSSFAGGYSILSKLRPEIGKINADTQNIFESIGFTKLQSKAMATELKYMDSKEQIGIWQALANFEKTKQEYQNLVAEHNNIIGHYDEIINNIDLIKAEIGEVEARKQYELAMKGKVDEDTRFVKAGNDFFDQHHYRLGTPIYESLRDMAVSNGSFDMETFGNEISGYQGKVSTAVEQAKAAASWNYRPSTVTEAAVYAGTTIGSSLRDLILSSQGVTNWSSLAAKLQTNAAANREFNQAYKDAKEDLYEEYLSKKRYYRNIRRGGNTQEVARAKMAMETAKSNYESLTKENFGDELIKSISPR